MESPGQSTGVGNLSLLQGIFPTQGPNPGLPSCRRILYQVSHKGSLGYRLWGRKESDKTERLTPSLSQNRAETEKLGNNQC